MAPLVADFITTQPTHTMSVAAVHDSVFNRVADQIVLL